MLKKQILKAGLMTVLVMAPCQGAFAATGQTDVTINFPNIIILHYISNLTLTFTGDIDSNQDQGNATNSQALGDATFDANMTASGGSVIPGSVNIEVDNVWAVRGITASGQIRVSGTIDTANATSNGSTATMSALQVSSGATAAAGTIDITSPGFAVANAALGNIHFALDISGVTEATSHTGMQYTITAIATP